MKKYLVIGLLASMVLAGAQTASAAFGYGGGGGGGSYVGGGNVPSLGGGSGFAPSYAPVITPAPAVGRVLGAQIFNFTHTLYTGMSSDEVKELQNKLKELGYFNNPTSTGYFGSLTRAAVRAFQKVLVDTYAIPSTVRQRRGIDIAAGCGQLAGAAVTQTP